MYSTVLISKVPYKQLFNIYHIYISHDAFTFPVMIIYCSIVYDGLTAEVADSE